MKRYAILLLIAAFVAVGVGFAPQEKAEKKEVTTKNAEVYSCPMHPDVKSDKPGECPKCKMTLEKMTKKAEMKSGMKGSCCCAGCGKGKGASMKMECPSDSTHSSHAKMTMKGCCAK